MATAEEGIATQIRNIEARYGKTMAQWSAIVAASGLTRHQDVVSLPCSPTGSGCRPARTSTPSSPPGSGSRTSTLPADQTHRPGRRIRPGRTGSAATR